MEIAGVALAVLPLLISAAENYQKICCQPFSRYRKFSKEVQRYLVRLGNQQTIFRVQCLHLLADVVESNAAESMLKDAEHPFWSSEQLEGQIAQLLGESRGACIETIRLISEILDDVEVERQNLLAAVECEQSTMVFITRFKSKEVLTVFCPQKLGNGKLSARDWKKRVASKVKFSFSDTRLAQNLNTLCDLNLDFRTLSSQMKVSGSGISQDTRLNQGFHLNAIRANREIGEASQVVYDALNNACHKHIEHKVHLCLEVEQISRGDDISSMQLRFSMAFANAANHSELVWVAIKAIADGQGRLQTANGADCSDILANTLKRHIDTISDPPRTHPEKKRVRIQLPSAGTSDAARKVLRKEPNEVEVIINGNLCDFLHRRSLPADECEGRVGILASKAQWRSLVYPMQAASGLNYIDPLTPSGTIFHGLSKGIFTVAIDISARTFSQNACHGFPQISHDQLGSSLLAKRQHMLLRSRECCRKQTNTAHDAPSKCKDLGPERHTSDQQFRPTNSSWIAQSISVQAWHTIPRNCIFSRLGDVEIEIPLWMSRLWPVYRFLPSEEAGQTGLFWDGRCVQQSDRKTDRM